MSQRVTGFEFLIERTDGTRAWVRLQGSGGLIGAGCLTGDIHRPGAAARLHPVIEQCLKRAVTEANMYGTVRVFSEHPEPAERITVTPVRTVLECRPIRDTHTPAGARA